MKIEAALTPPQCQQLTLNVTEQLRRPESSFMPCFTACHFLI